MVTSFAPCDRGVSNPTLERVESVLPRSIAIGFSTIAVQRPLTCDPITNGRFLTKAVWQGHSLSGTSSLSGDSARPERPMARAPTRAVRTRGVGPDRRPRPFGWSRSDALLGQEGDDRLLPCRNIVPRWQGGVVGSWAEFPGAELDAAIHHPAGSEKQHHENIAGRLGRTPDVLLSRRPIVTTRRTLALRGAP
jgi:hypothetical protein